MEDFFDIEIAWKIGVLYAQASPAPQPGGPVMRPGENYQFGICRNCGVQFVRPPGNDFAYCSFFNTQCYYY